MTETPYSINDLVRLLGMSPRTVREWARRGWIPGRIELPYGYYYNREDVDRWLKARGPKKETET